MHNLQSIKRQPLVVSVIRIPLPVSKHLQIGWGSQGGCDSLCVDSDFVPLLTAKFGNPSIATSDPRHSVPSHEPRLSENDSKVVVKCSLNHTNAI